MDLLKEPGSGTPARLILASSSPFRRSLMTKAGLQFDAVAADLDERALEAPLQDSGVTPDEVAQVLAEAKAGEVSQRYPHALVLGCDQTLSLDDRVFHKPANMEGARRHLLDLSGRTHQLNSALVLVRGGETLWRHVSIARLTMRTLDPGFVGRHLARVGDRALTSVGAYQIEGEGINLFERIEGDTFTIMGLPLLPLLAKLRDMGAIDG